MAGTMVHLFVAQKLLSCMQENTWEYSFGKSNLSTTLFYAGNICPDGIMARNDYKREMKLHTHFRDGIPDGTFAVPEHIRLFRRRMKDFWKMHQMDEKVNTGLYLGYITHMMTDEYFILEVRPVFFEKISGIGLTQQDRETFVIFNEETDAVDFELLRNNKVLLEAKEALERVEPYEIKGMITKEELTRSREWILEHFFYKEHIQIPLRFLSYPDMVRFAEKTAQNIWQRLLEEEYVFKSR